MKKKAIFMGTPDISVPFLDFLVERNVDTLVFTQKDMVRKRGGNFQPSPVKSRALELNLPVYDFSVKSAEAFDIISGFMPDIYLVVAYGQILPRQILAIPKLPVNVHFSMLPEYRGSTPVNTAILDGRNITGTTIMKMDEGLDTGGIIAQEKIVIESTDNATSLFRKLTVSSLALLDKNIDFILNNNCTILPQNGNISYTRLISKNDLIIDFCKESFNVFNMIKAYNNEPGVRTYFRNKILMIEAASYGNHGKGLPGTIFDVSKKSFKVACSTGYIEILKLKPEGKKSMDVSAFIAGYKPFDGEILG